MHAAIARDSKLGLSVAGRQLISMKRRPISIRVGTAYRMKRIVILGLPASWQVVLLDRDGVHVHQPGRLFLPIGGYRVLATGSRILPESTPHLTGSGWRETAATSPRSTARVRSGMSSTAVQAYEGRAHSAGQGRDHRGRLLRSQRRRTDHLHIGRTVESAATVSTPGLCSSRADRRGRARNRAPAIVHAHAARAVACALVGPRYRNLCPARQAVDRDPADRAP